MHGQLRVRPGLLHEHRVEVDGGHAVATPGQLEPDTAGAAAGVEDPRAARNEHVDEPGLPVQIRPRMGELGEPLDVGPGIPGTALGLPSRRGHGPDASPGRGRQQATRTSCEIRPACSSVGAVSPFCASSPTFAITS